MLLRYLVSHYVRQAAEQKLQEVVQHAADPSKRAADPSKRATDPSKQPAEEEGADEAPPLQPEVLFFFATATESGGMVDRLEGRQTTQFASFLQHVGLIEGRPVGVVETGVGLESAQAIDDAIKLHRPAWVVSAGFAAALQSDVRRGEILMADEITNCDATERLDVGLKISPESAAAVRGLRLGRLASVDQLLSTGEQKRNVAEQSLALACDMESLSVAKRCQAQHIRFMSVQVITDALDDRMPPEVEKMLSQGTLAARLGAAAGAIFNRPSSVKDMWNLKERALRATDRLAKFLVSMLPQLV